jgi:hypothetical protein
MRFDFTTTLHVPTFELAKKIILCILGILTYFYFVSLFLVFGYSFISK